MSAEISAEPAASDTSAASDGSFTSLGDIRVAHLGLMRQASECEQPEVDGDRAPSAGDIRAFLAGARQTGRVIGTQSDRRSAQRILDYWSAELVARPAITKDDITPARLVPFATGGGSMPELPGTDPTAPPSDTATSVEAAQPDPDLTADEEAERLRIRVAAQARQWENTRYDGYLLRGKALAQATDLPADHDIDAFLKASAEAEGKGRRQRDLFRKFLLFCFIGLSAILAYAAIYANNRANDAIAARMATDAALRATILANDEAHQAKLAAESEKAKADAGLGIALNNFDDANKRLQELGVARDTLDSAVAFIAEALIGGSIRLDDLNDELRNLVLAQIAGKVNSGERGIDVLPPSLQQALQPLVENLPDFLSSDLPGYQPDFLGTEISLPELTGERAADVLDAPSAYINYSLVLSRSHRMAFYAAVNLDRSQQMVLQTTSGWLVPDGRLDLTEQPDPDWYSTALSTALIPAQLANAGDIAWGQVFTGDPGAAGLKLALYANVLPNSMPLPPSLANGVWPQLETWIRNQHNPLANRVTIFTGPVFGPTTAGNGTGALPDLTGYWKVAVSPVSPAIKGQVLDPDYEVDAFLIPRDTTSTAFQPSEFRVSIAELQHLTGIDFGDLINWTDTTSFPGPDGKTAADMLAARVGLLDSSVASERQSLRGELLAVLGNRDLSVVERRKVVAALTDMASTVNMLPLSQVGRLNVLEALIWVPGELWRSPDWLQLWAQARVAAGDLEVRSDNGETNIGRQTRMLLDGLKGQLGIGPSRQTVWFQFAGMSREQAERLSARMRALGWAIAEPGEERVAAAEGMNEVRYNPDSSADRAAAELLAADLTAAGQTAMARPVMVIGPNTLEIWVSI